MHACMRMQACSKQKFQFNIRHKSKPRRTSSRGVPLIINTPFPISLTRGRTQFRSVVLYLGSREGIFVFFFPMALVRPSQNGERAGPLAKMLLGAKHGGRPRIMSRIIVEEYFAL